MYVRNFIMFVAVLFSRRGALYCATYRLHTACYNTKENTHLCFCIQPIICQCLLKIENIENVHRHTNLRLTNPPNKVAAIIFQCFMTKPYAS